MASIAKLTIELNANVARLQQDMAQAQRTVQTSTQGMKSAVQTVQSAFVALGVGMAAVNYARGVQAALEQAESMNNLSQRTGIATETLSGYRVAAELADVSQEDLATGLKKLAVNMAAAAGGAREQGKLFDAMGLSVTGSNGALKSTDAMMREIALKFESFRDGPEKAALAVALFGKAGDNMIPLLNNLSRATDEARRLGVVLSGDTAKAAEEFNDNLKRMAILSEHAKLQIGSYLAPRLIAISEDFIEAAASGKRWLAVLKAIGDLTSITDPKAIAEQKEIIRLVERRLKLEEEIGRLRNDQVQGPGRKQQIDMRQAEIAAIDSRAGALSAKLSPEDPRNFDARDWLARRKLPTPIADKSGEDKKREIEGFLRALEEETIKKEQLTRVSEVLALLDTKRYASATAGERALAVSLATRQDKQKQQTDDLKAYGDEVDASIDRGLANTRAWNAFNKAQEDQAEGFRRLVDPTREFMDQQRLVGELVNAGRLSAEEGEIAYFKLTQRIAEVSGAMVGMDMNGKKLDQVAGDLGYTFTSAFEDAALSGKKLSEVLQALDKDIARIILRRGISEPLGEGITGFMKGLFRSSGPEQLSGPAESGGAWDFIKGFFGGGRAAGGPLESGKWYIAGERGPEPIWGGGPGAFAAGSGAGAGPINLSIVMNNHMIDTRGMAQAIAPLKNQIVGMVNQAFNERGRLGPLGA